MLHMLRSQLFVKTSKTPPADADSINARLLTQGGFIHKQMAGVYNYLPMGLRVLRKIQHIIREEMNALGAHEILMPALTQLESYKTTGRENLDILFRARGHDESEYVLNQSHEEVVTPLVQKHVFSYRDLPVAVYQIQDKFRNEPRAKSGILRGREFNMKDLYSFHATGDDLNAFYEQVSRAYVKILNHIGIGDRTVFTYASGGSFSSYSHEFQTLCETGEDTIYLCSQCNVAVNKEIIHEQDRCPECGNKNLTERSAIEVGNIFKLRSRFSEAFNFTYVDAEGSSHLVEMGCYGIGPSRLMGTLVELFNDAKGIIWPQSIAPFDTHLLGLDADDRDIFELAQKVYQRLSEHGIEVLYDDRRDVSAGEKLAEADLIGIPWRVIVSKRTGDRLELKERKATTPELLTVEQCVARIRV